MPRVCLHRPAARELACMAALPAMPALPTCDAAELGLKSARMHVALQCMSAPRALARQPNVRFSSCDTACICDLHGWRGLVRSRVFELVIIDLGRSARSPSRPSELLTPTLNFCSRALLRGAHRLAFNGRSLHSCTRRAADCCFLFAADTPRATHFAISRTSRQHIRTPRHDDTPYA